MQILHFLMNVCECCVSEKYKTTSTYKTNRLFHTLIWKTGGSSTSDRDVMSFHEWSAVERVERHK